MARKTPKETPGEKVVDDRVMLKRPRRGASLREEIWQTRDGSVTRYNLAYVNRWYAAWIMGACSGMTTGMAITTGISWGKCGEWDS